MRSALLPPPPSSMSTTTTAEAEAEESIYNLLPKTYTPPPKPPLYRSPRLRHAARQPPFASTFGAFGGPHLLGQARFERRAWAHWGPAERQAADPKRFLRRGEGAKTAQLPASEALPYHDRAAEPRKPPVPSPQCQDAMGKEERVVYDFVYANAMGAITAAPPPPPPAPMDFLRKPDHGQAPAYLASVKEEIRREDALLARFLQRQRQRQRGRSEDQQEEEEEEGKSQGVVAPLPEEERRALVDALKAKWDAINAAYQKTAHHGGRHQSIGERQRKEAQEQVMSQLEADIELLQRGGHAGGLYIRYDDDDGAVAAAKKVGKGKEGPAAA